MSDRGDELVRLIDEADEPAIVALLGPLAEPERKDLVTAVVERVHVHKKGADDNSFPPRPDANLVRARTHAAFLAWLGTDDLNGLPPPPPPGGYDSDNMRWFLHRAGASAAGHQVLCDRRPEWLPGLAEQFLDYGYWMWDPVWRLVMDGLIDRPSTPRYLEGLAGYLGRSEEWSVAEMVRRDPLLLERDFPALLDLPGGLGMLCHGDRRDTGMGRDRASLRAWSPVLAALPAGHPLRDRLLTDLLEALGGDLGREAPAYQSFLNELHPSATEYAGRQGMLLRLVGHRQSAIVTFAVTVLSKVDKKHPLDPDEVVARLGPASAASSATAARSALRLITTAVKRRPDLAGAAASALTPALTDRRPEIQLEAVTALSPYADDDRVNAALSAAAPDLSPTATAALPAGTATGETGDDLADAITETEAVLQALSDVDLRLALTAARAAVEAEPVEPNPLRDARPGPYPVTPVDGLNDLVDTLLHVVDGSIRATSTIERGLDGLAALHLERPAEFGLLVGPLVVRVNKAFEDRPGWGNHFTTDFCYLVAQWIVPQRAIAEPDTVDSPRTWLIARVREVAAMIQAGTAARLLALPTEEYDWIEPAVLAQRAIDVGDEALTRPYDVATAIGRLAPWGRAEAVHRLEGIGGTLAAVVRRACGGDEAVDRAPEIVRRALAWHRDRPAGGAPYLFGEAPLAPPTEVGLPHDGYERATRTVQPDGSIFWDLTVVPEWQEYRRWMDHVRHTRYGFGWALSQWPGDTGWVWVDDLWSRRAMRYLLDPGEPLPVAAVTQVVKLIGDGAADHRTLASDILARAISDGRLTSDRLCAAMTAAMGSGERLATELVTIAGTSSLHRAVVARALTATLPSWTQKAARPLCTVLGLLDDIFTGDRMGLASPEARAALTPLSTGRSKTATLARRVLAHEPVEHWPAAARAAALRARIDRAKRRTSAV